MSPSLQRASVIGQLTQKKKKKVLDAKTWLQVCLCVLAEPADTAAIIGVINRDPFTEVSTAEHTHTHPPTPQSVNEKKNQRGRGG